MRPMPRSAASRAFSSLVRPQEKQAFCRSHSKIRPKQPHLSSSSAFATSSANCYEPNPYADTPNDRPRWEAPPPRMTAPFRSKPPVEDNDFPVNEDPSKLNDALDRLLGENGHLSLTTEARWLAVTHKSFDHGRRGYNDRLAFIGKRILELQVSLALVHGPSSGPRPTRKDEFGRQPFRHSALDGLDALVDGPKAKARFLDKRRMAQLAESHGLDTVIRWKPKNARDKKGLNASGQPVVLQQTLYAIVGALSLQNGAIVANDVIRKRILSPLGLL